MNPLASLMFLGVGQSNMSTTFLGFGRRLSSSHKNPTISIPFIPIADLVPEIVNPAIQQSLINVRKISACSNTNRRTSLYLASTHFNHDNFVPISILGSLYSTIINERPYIMRNLTP